MSRNRSSIIAAGRLLALGLGMALLAGCGTLLPFGTAALDVRTTGAVAPVAAKIVATPQTVDPTDWEALRVAAATTLLDAAPGVAFDWANPDTGTSGTLTALTATATRADGDCRSFSTTLSDLRGVRHYRIDACARPGGRFEFAQVTADDAALL